MISCAHWATWINFNPTFVRLSNLPHITLRDVAKEAGVSLATVSRALRDDPSTAEKTRKHVQGVAEKLGYRPDPALQVLIERRWRGRRADEGLNLCFLYNSESADAPVAARQFKRFKASSKALGYTLIPIDMSEFANVQKLIYRLESQGVSGIVFALLSSTSYDISELCQRFAAVSINVSQVQPNCPIITHDEFRSIEKVWKQLTSLGYKRFGVIFEEYPDSFSMDQRLGAVYCRQRFVKPAENRIPIFIYEKNNPEEIEKLRVWLDKYQPDVLLGDTHHEVEILDAIGVRVPDDVAFASVNMWDPSLIGNIAGYFRDNVVLFERGLQLLNMMVRSGATGASQGQLMEMVNGVWIDGRTLPALT
ncbi:LacI family DNA-binding transcriptional regulator [Cerasicoccus maritimus]|uniref:LacI family DNA-binding transcriptional regulator n=1 Tax=Cerasicoccus maritimus TaxID=490089 RepID=UPI00285286D4|nr:LacI family DNA-binding transcriptional regulator [Cerasicoccus maritimus]